MKKTKLLLVGCFALTTLLATAQQNEDKPKKKKAAKEKKVILDDAEIDVKIEDEGKKNEKATIIINGKTIERNGKNDVMTITVDGDKVKIDGKDVETMDEKELNDLKVRGSRLKLIAPFLKNRKSFSFGGDLDELQEILGGNMPPEFNMPRNKALLGVVTETHDTKGAKIKNVSKESAAEKAGLKKDDVIIKLNDDEITTSDDLTRSIGKYNPDEKVKITYLRDGKEESTKATLLRNNIEEDVKVFSFNGDEMNTFRTPFEGDFDMMKFNNKPKIGAKVQDVEEGDGVKVLDVEENTPAAKAGLQKNDIIVEVNNDVLKGVDDLRKKLRDVKEGETYNITYKRNGALEKTQVKFPKKLKTADL